MKVGVISDTHGRLRPQVFTAFRDVDRILHAGDIGPPDILVELEAVAAVSAVYGNTDGFELRERLPEQTTEEWAGYRVTVIHGHQLGTPTAAKLRELISDTDIIVYGHTHRPAVDREDGILVMNPGSAGAPKLGLAPSVAILELHDDGPRVEVIELR